MRTAGRKIRSVALPSHASSCGGLPTTIDGYTASRRIVIAVTWKTGNGSTGV